MRNVIDTLGACIILSLTLIACTPMDLISSVMGSSDGVDATAQVAEDANKGTIAVQAGTKNDLGSVTGDAKIVNNSSMGMASMALIGMIPFVLLCFYLLPAPKWIQRRYSEKP